MIEHRTDKSGKISKFVRKCICRSCHHVVVIWNVWIERNRRIIWNIIQVPNTSLYTIQNDTFWTSRKERTAPRGVTTWAPRGLAGGLDLPIEESQVRFMDLERSDFYSFGVTDAFSRKDDSRADSCALTAPLIFCANIYIFSVMWHVLKLVAAM